MTKIKISTILLILLFVIFLAMSVVFAAPRLEPGTWGLNKTTVHRGEAILAYAEWNETVNSSVIEYNSTSSTLVNTTFGCLYGCNNSVSSNWTNYTITTGNNWLLGNHTVKIYVNSTNQSSTSASNSTSGETFTVWGWSNLTWVEPASASGSITYHKGESVVLVCNVSDSNTTQPLDNYTVSFYNATTHHLLGINQTNSSGIAVYNNWTLPIALTPGKFYPSCNITDNSTQYYNASENFEANTTIGIWGWSMVNKSMHNGPVNQNQTIEFKCRIIDANTSASLNSSYPVDFYVGADHYINYTGSDGWAYYHFNKSSTETYQLKCNITHNATLYYNITSENEKNTTIVVTDQNITWSSPGGEFALTRPSTGLHLNWTNDNSANFAAWANDSLDYETRVEVNNMTTGIIGNYSQNSLYDYTSIYADCLHGTGLGNSTFDNPLVVKNSTGHYANNAIFGRGEHGNFTLIHSVVCPPGRYWGTVGVTNATENANLTVTIDVPISTENELNATTGVAGFEGRFPANATTYHSYFFNTSAVENATAIVIDLAWGSSANDLDLFLIHHPIGSLIEKSIRRNTNTEELWSTIPSDGSIGEIRIYGNISTAETYTAHLNFTTLNAFNSSNPSQQLGDWINFGGMHAGNFTRVNAILKNAGNLTLSNVAETELELYHTETVGSSADPANFIFLVPVHATKVRADVNWTGSSNYTLSLYKPDGTLFNTSTGRHANANASGVMQEEFVVYDQTVGQSNEGYWKVGVTNNTNVTPHDPYNVTLKFWVNASEWISSNYTEQTFNSTNNKTQNFHFNLTVQNDTLSGMYDGLLMYESGSGSTFKIRFKVNVITPVMIVHNSLNSSTVSITDNTGFNRTWSRVLNVTVNNTGNVNLTFDQSSSSALLNNTGSGSGAHCINFTYEAPGFIPPGESAKLNITFDINTVNTSNDDGIYRGWIYLNSSEAHPHQGFNLTVEVNLTNKLQVGILKITTADGNEWIENSSRRENITIHSRVWLINETTLTGGNDIEDLWPRNFTVTLREGNVTTYTYTVPSTDKFNGTNPTTVYNILPVQEYQLNVTVPKDLPGGRYVLSLGATHSIGGAGLSGTGTYDWLVINDTGLELTAVSQKVISVYEGNTTYFNASVVNYGPMKASGTIKLDNSACTYATISSYKVTSGCGSVIQSGDNFTIDVNANGSEVCIFRWKIVATSDVAGDKTCQPTLTVSDRNFGSLTGIKITVVDDDDPEDSTDGTDGTTGGDTAPSCTCTDWVNQSCGAGTCASTEMKQTRTCTGCSSGMSTSRCVANSACIIPVPVSAINITEYPSVIEIVQGRNGSATIKVKNIGDTKQYNLSMTVTPIPPTWYNISPEKFDLYSGSQKTFTVNFTISENAPKKDYPLSFNVSNVNVSDWESATLKVLLSEEKYSDVNQTYEEYLANYTALAEKIGKLGKKKTNISVVNETLATIYSKLQSANASIQSGDYDAAYDSLEEIKTLLGGIELPVPPPSRWWLWTIVVIATVAGGGLLIYTLLPVVEKHGYKPEKGFKFKPPGEPSSPSERLSQLKERVKTAVKKLKEKLSRSDHNKKYDFERKGDESWEHE